MTTRSTTTADWAEQINLAWQKGVSSIIETGRLLIAAKDDLKKKGQHGQFERMIENELTFGPSTAQRLMAIAADTRLTNPAHVQLLPPHWGTLYELTKLSNEKFAACIADGRINAEMERAGATKLVRSHSLKAMVEAHSGRRETPDRDIASEPQAAETYTASDNADSGPVIKCKSITTAKFTAAEFAARRQADRVVESLELLEEKLADEMIAQQVIELLRIRDKDLFRVRRALDEAGSSTLRAAS